MSAARIHSAREKYMKIKRLLNALAGVLADIDAGFVQAWRAAAITQIEIAGSAVTSDAHAIIIALTYLVE